MKTSDFEYDLPPELIAQQPAAVRDACRLLVMDRATGALEDRIFRDIVDYVNPGDLLVVNETRVMPARLLGAKRASGGAAEVFLLRQAPGYGKHASAGASESCADAGMGTLAQPADEASGSPSDAVPPCAAGASSAAAVHGAPARAYGANQVAYWEALVKPGKRLKPGSGAIVDFRDAGGNVALSAEVVDWAQAGARGERIVRLTTPLPSLDEALHAVGRTPLPPYIKDYAGDEELYQTVYARRESSAAAPTAGLHFTPELIERLREKGAQWQTVELEVGLDTFRIVDEDDPALHEMHTERYTVPERTAQAIANAKAAGRRVIAVGTTSVRSLESAWDASAGRVTPRDREATQLYLLPGSEFHVVDALVTNFHVPRSTLMMLVSAFSTRDNVMAAYRHAVQERYRFFSFGDAMLIC